MKSNRLTSLSQAVNSRTWTEYQLRVLLLSAEGLVGKWIPGVFMLIFAVLIKFLQDHYDFTVKNKGWFLVYLPYAGILIAAWLYHALRAGWLVHRATKNHIVVTHLEWLLQQGQVIDSDFVNLVDAKTYWSKSVSRWQELVGRTILGNWTEAEQKKFFNLGIAEYIHAPGPEQHREMLKRYCANLESLIAELKK